MLSRVSIGLWAIAKIELCTNQGFKSFVSKSGNTAIYLYYLISYQTDEAIGCWNNIQRVFS